MTADLKSRIAEELAIAPEALTAETVLATCERWDSVTVLTLMVILSDALGTAVTPEEMARLKTFGDIEALVAITVRG